MVVADSRGARRGRGRADRGRMGAAAGGRRHGRGRATGRSARPPGVGHQRGGRLHATASATPTRVFADAPTCVSETFRRPALRRDAAGDSRRRRAVGPPRRHAHDVEQHAGLALRAAGPGRRARASAPPIRVIAPDLGGGFGTKASGYAEDLLVPAAAIVLGRPVKWIERSTRAHDGRGPRSPPGARDRARPRGATARSSPCAITSGSISAPTTCGASCSPTTRSRTCWARIACANMHVEVEAVVTHKTPNAPYRGAGRPETVFAMDRAVDCLARELGIDPAEIRRTQLHPRRGELPYDLGMPYRDGNPLVYDTGDFPRRARAALEAAGYAAFRARAGARCARAGIYRGIGISGYVEGTAIGPFEGAHVTLDLAGRVLVATGAVSSGQGHETSFAQIAADALGVPLEWVTVIGGDTAAVPFGVGTFASRSARDRGQLDRRRGARGAGQAGRTRRRRCSRPRAADVEIEDGQVSVRGAPGSAMPLARVIQASIPTFAKPGVAPPDFEASVLSPRADRDVRQRRARGAGRGGRRDRRRQAAALPRGPRLRQGHQSGDRRRADPRRRRPGRGRRALRGDGLRRRGPAPDGHAHGLPVPTRRSTCRRSRPCTSNTRPRATRSASRGSARAAPSRRRRPSPMRWTMRWRRSACGSPPAPPTPPASAL